MIKINFIYSELLFKYSQNLKDKEFTLINISIGKKKNILIKLKHSKIIKLKEKH